MAEEQVYMTHEATKAIGGPVPLSAFETYWGPQKGWKRTEVDFETGDDGQARPVARKAKTAATSGGK